jgi:hypothetical protein
MGFHVSWLAIRGKSGEVLRTNLKLRETTERQPFPESDQILGIDLPSGWYLVYFSHTFAPVCDDQERLKLLSTDAEIISCTVEETSMTSEVVMFENGQRCWWVFHLYFKDRPETITEGDLPTAYFTIRDKILAQQEADGDDGEGVDYEFDLPAELAQHVTGYWHGQEFDDIQYVVLEGIS